jgi:hypothetical protein
MYFYSYERFTYLLFVCLIYCQYVSPDLRTPLYLLLHLHTGTAPLLWKQAAVENMPAGSVTVDLASSAGGNVETTSPGNVIQHGGVTCVGYNNWPSLMANTSSTLFSGNCTKFLGIS